MQIPLISTILWLTILQGAFGQYAWVLRNMQFKYRCLQVQGNSQSNNADLELGRCDLSKVPQTMELFNAAGMNYGSAPGVYVKFYSSGKCLTVNGGSSTNGARINQYDCVGATNQLWYIYNYGDNGFQLMSNSSGKCLTSEGSGAYMDIWDCVPFANAPHQYWNIGLLQNIYGNLVNYQYNTKCLHPAAESTAEDAGLELTPCSGVTNVNFGFEFGTNTWMPGYASFANGKCMAVNGGGTSDGTVVNQHTCTMTANQNWKVVNGDISGSFQLQNPASGKCLTAEGGGTYTDIYGCCSIVNCPHQWWTFSIPQVYPYTIRLKNAQTDGCLHVVGDSSANNANLEVVTCGSNQNLYVSYGMMYNYGAGTGYFYLNGAKTKCMTVNGAGTSNGDLVNQYDCWSVTHQQWKIIGGNPYGYVQIKNVNSGKCLTYEYHLSPPTVDQYDCVTNVEDAPHQFWSFN